MTLIFTRYQKKNYKQKKKRKKKLFTKLIVNKRFTKHIKF